jgi:hypothetical protein
MTTPAPVEPPTPENVHLYRAAILAWRKAEIEERSRHVDVRLANPHVANHAAALAVHALAPESDVSLFSGEKREGNVGIEFRVRWALACVMITFVS